MPVASAARLGAQTPEVENALVKRMPSSASRLMFGVLTVLSPNGGMIGLRSSATNHTIFGLGGNTGPPLIELVAVSQALRPQKMSAATPILFIVLLMVLLIVVRSKWNKSVHPLGCFCYSA